MVIFMAVCNAQFIKEQQERVLVSVGKKSPELVLKNATFVNVFTNELETGDIAIHKGVIVGIGDYTDVEIANSVDCEGMIVSPGFIDGHIHIESSMLAPQNLQQL
jgi:adenine deaminase